MAQMKDAATKVFNREKTTALSELFTIELKFTIDTLVTGLILLLTEIF